MTEGGGGSGGRRRGGGGGRGGDGEGLAPAGEGLVHLPPLQQFLQGMLRHLQHGRRASGTGASVRKTGLVDIC